jgi:hypothetical protein
VREDPLSRPAQPSRIVTRRLGPMPPTPPSALHIPPAAILRLQNSSTKHLPRLTGVALARRLKGGCELPDHHSQHLRNTRGTAWRGCRPRSGRRLHGQRIVRTARHPTPTAPIIGGVLMLFLAIFSAADAWYQKFDPEESFIAWRPSHHLDHPSEPGLNESGPSG